MPRLIDADKLIYSDGREYLPTGKYITILDIENAPTVDAEPVRHGYWIVDEDGNIKCSECGHHGVGDNYCENCGATMVGRRREDAEN